MTAMAMTLRLDENDTAALKAYAERHQISMQQAAQEGVRRLVRDEQVDQYIGMILREDADLLHRLSK